METANRLYQLLLMAAQGKASLWEVRRAVLIISLETYVTQNLFNT